MLDRWEEVKSYVSATFEEWRVAVTPLRHEDWLDRFVAHAAELDPDMPVESLNGLAAYWSRRAELTSPEDEARTAIVWVRNGGTGH